MEPADLFALPLSEFVAARDAMAKALPVKERGPIKGLKKPTVSAWVVNQLAHKRLDGLTSLLDAGGGVREAQRAALTGQAADLPGAMMHLRTTLEAYVRQAGDLLVADGHAAADATLSRARTTLEAIALYGDALPGPAPGQLSVDVDPPGFDVLLALAAATPMPDVSVPTPDAPAPMPEGLPPVAEPVVEEPEGPDLDALEERLLTARLAVKGAEASRSSSADAARAAHAALAAHDARIAEAQAVLDALVSEREAIEEAVSQRVSEVSNAERRVAAAQAEVAEARAALSQALTSQPS